MAEHTRTLDFKIAFAMGLGTMIAAGIFSLSGEAVYRIGSTAVVAFVLAALVAGITAASYSEFASIYAENGGGYLFSSRTFEGRELLTYGIGMSLFLGYTGTTAFYLATMDEWFFRFLVPEAFHWLPTGTWGVLAAVMLGVLNARGTEESGAFQLLVTAAKVAVLLIFVGGMFASVGVTPATTEFAGEFEFAIVDTVSVAALAFITFFGFSAIAASAGEIIEPRKTVPRAIAASIGTVTVLYAFVIVAMVNIGGVAGRLTRTPEQILQLGETAMGAVAQAFIPITVAGVPVGEYLIVAGAIFSMVSASNASILAASSIGSLMGKQGQAPRQFSRIHPQFGTPFWSVTSATAVIVALVVVFRTLFGHHGYLAPIDLGVTLGPIAIQQFRLGLNPLTGFATLNLLLPLAVVNYALIVNRRKFPDAERGFRVPGVPAIPALGIVANLALIYNLPVVGVVIGLSLIGVLFVAYTSWGGGPDVDDLVQRVEAPSAPNGGEAADHDYRVLVPIARPARAPAYVRLADHITEGESPVVQVLTVTEIPDQTPHELVGDTASERTERIRDELADADIDADYVVEGQTCRDVSFAITNTARQDGADRILMGYPEENPDITEGVEYAAPCDVVFASGVPDEEDFSVVNFGAGGGPHHEALLPLVEHLGRSGDLHLVHVTPSGDGGTTESVGDTLDRLRDVDCEVHQVSADSVARGLVDAATENGGLLVVGASRDRSIRQWVLGSTPDRVVELARESDVPVLIYASETGVPERIEDRLFPVYRYLQKVTG
jgi:amino acid transporter/nucleotide-binding universal stress UspA family protein